MEYGWSGEAAGCPADSEAPPTLYGSTRKGTLLESVSVGVVTWTVPVVAPAGTVAVMSARETTVNVAAVPSKVTLVAPLLLALGGAPCLLHRPQVVKRQSDRFEVIRCQRYP